MEGYDIILQRLKVKKCYRAKRENTEIKRKKKQKIKDTKNIKIP